MRAGKMVAVAVVMAAGIGVAALLDMSANGGREDCLERAGKRAEAAAASGWVSPSKHAELTQRMYLACLADQPSREGRVYDER